MNAPETGEIQVERVARYFQARTGVDLSRAARHATVAIRGAMREAGEPDPDRYLARLERDEAAFDALTAALTVGESYFFRDAWHFDLIAAEVLPELARERPAGPGLRAWSAGCAGGEEVYSLAMVLAEREALDGAWLLGTDLSSAALAKAKAGRYRDWSLRGAAAERAARWVRREGPRWRVDARLRSAVTFRRLNLATELYPTTETGTRDLDVVFCRNVLIYFDGATVEAVAQRLTEALRPGGWLITGPSDPPLSELARLDVVARSDGVVYRRPARAATRPRRSHRRARERSPRPAPGRSAAARPEGSPDRAPSVPDKVVERLRRMASLNPELTLEQVEARLRGAPKNVPLALLRATLLVSLDRPRRAEEALHAMLELDPSCALAHFMLASLRLRAGDLAGARAGWERARALTEALPPEQPLAQGDGETAGALADAARRQLDLLEGLEVG